MIFSNALRNPATIRPFNSPHQDGGRKTER
jgi:hypothetical protein